MGLQFILGRAGANKNAYIHSKIKEKSLCHPQGRPIFYLVPDQMTFEQEYTLFRDPEFKGSIRTQVASLSRLAWHILQETGGSTRQFISSVGIQMMLRKIIEEKQGNWEIFQKATEKQGFLTQLETIITEFKRYLITPEMLFIQKNQLEQFKHREPGEQSLIHKLSDLSYIYEKLNIALQDSYIDSEDQLQLLAEKIKESTLLEGAEIYLNGFHRFTPTELSVIQSLLLKCKQVTVALTVADPEADDISDLDLFYQTTETYHILKQMAEENGIQLEQSIMLRPEHGQFHDKPDLLHLEQYFDARPAPEYAEQTDIQIAEAVHPRAEIEGVAQEIRRLVQEEGYRYRDIAILVREPEVYHDLIQTIFPDYHIPVFIDEKRTMLNHSLIEFIRSALEVVDGNWRYDAVFRMLKTGFISATDATYPLTDDAIDELENYVLEYGIRSRSRWLKDEKWIFQRFHGFDQTAQTDEELETQARINAYRNQIVQAMATFDEQIRAADTIEAKCKIVYTWLEKLHVPEKLEQLRTFYDEEGQLEKGREQEQVWNAVIQLFEEIVEITGDETLDLQTFRVTLEAGFETLKFAHVPPSIDHTIVGSVDRSRISGIKCSFLLGVNDGIWPMKPAADSVINEEERELLAIHGMKLADSSKRKLLDDWFYIYLAFTSSEQYLWISYTISNEEGKATIPSQLIHRIEEMFPIRKELILLQEPDELEDAARFITTPQKTRSALTAQLARYRRGYPMHEVWWHVLNWYIKNHAMHGTTYHVLQSLFYENKPSSLSTQTAEKMYPKEIPASVSRLESYYRCSYQHFASYSLKLNERKTYKLDAPDIGQLFHEALKMITEWVQKEGRDFTQLSKLDARHYANRAIQQLAPVLQHQILHSSNRYKYIQKKLQEVIARAAFVLGEQARKSDFSPVGLELGFGKNQTLDPVRLELPNGFELVLGGRIDRVDKAMYQDQLFLRIIDYKSSAHGLNLVEVYYGLALQMLTYLDVILTQSETWLGLRATPAGVLYFHVHNPLISGGYQLTEEEIERELFKKYKMQGLLLANEDVVKQMDTSVDSGYSQMIPVGLKRNGGFYSNSKVASPETFATLQHHIHELMIQAGVDITSGGVELNPYQYKNKTACTFCPFLSVCQFDPLVEGNQYRKLQDMKDNEILASLRKEEEN